MNNTNKAFFGDVFRFLDTKSYVLEFTPAGNIFIYMNLQSQEKQQNLKPKNQTNWPCSSLRKDFPHHLGQNASTTIVSFSFDVSFTAPVCERVCVWVWVCIARPSPYTPSNTLLLSELSHHGE